MAYMGIPSRSSRAGLARRIIYDARDLRRRGEPRPLSAPLRAVLARAERGERTVDRVVTVNQPC
jgi:hypothetical protein